MGEIRQRAEDLGAPRGSASSPSSTDPSAPAPAPAVAEASAMLPATGTDLHGAVIGGVLATGLGALTIYATRRPGTPGP